ncbi:hypothetical protein DPMN_194368 [Dreissena polymorpha]|uniref:Uncharacterized protein n=1 Tax=Dreissena polymorpha TaxID=45954 RepID=A0A9D4BEN8_DREPO|nr:hypothetical protein DPMN_194368 [Dreissena polymorpha]
MAKFLLEKARQANLLYEQAKARRLAAAKLHVQKKEFVLPTQSSRSSRVIKPNKRFLEDDSIVPSMVKTKHTVSNESLLSPPSSTSQSPACSSKARTFSMNSSQNIPKLSSPRELFAETVGLFDQPLIVDGKRDRKPSLKLQLSDEDSSFLSQSISPLRSPLAAPKLGTGLFKQSQFQKSDHQPLFTSKKGSAIVQKAKLQLNRAALNKSKAALARSLKAEMKREAKYISKQKELQEPAVQIKAPLPLGINS